MKIEYASYTHIGGRENNEDAVDVLLEPQAFLAVVADGLGGCQNGEYASKQAVKTLTGYLRTRPFSEESLEEAVLQANRDVFALQEFWTEAKTTVAALWIQEGQALAANVGDTRIYQFRGGETIFQSTDHSMAQLAVIAGEISPGDIRGYPDRNKLTRALGWEDTPWVDIHTLRVEPGDRFLLCTDGFWEEITEEKMMDCAAGERNAEAWLREMRVLAQPRARDNNTAVTAVAVS